MIIIRFLNISFENYFTIYKKNICFQGKRTWEETYEKPPKHNAFYEPWYDEKYAHMEAPMSV